MLHQAPGLNSKITSEMETMFMSERLIDREQVEIELLPSAEAAVDGNLCLHVQHSEKEEQRKVKGLIH